MKTYFLVFLLVLLSSIASGQTAWKQVSATVAFTIKNRGSNVAGSFGNVKTSLVFSPDKLAGSSLKGTVNVNSINTGIRKRDEDLQGDKYFDAGRHPVIEMASTAIGQRGSLYTGTFNITMKGVTKQVEMPFEFVQNGNEGEFKGSFTINRRDFGVGGKGGLAIFLGDNVNVTLDIKVSKSDR